jgi:hypothetical protein
MSSHILGGKGHTPAQDGSQTVFKAHIGVDKFFFFVDQYQQADEPVKAATDEKNECQPGQRATHKIV